jgi:protein-disulfide isomerase
MKKLAFALMLAAAAPAGAFDGQKLVQNLRETLSLDTRTAIEVQGQPQPSNLGGLDKITVLVGGAPYTVYLTKDQKTYFWGFTADLTASPDRQRQQAMDSRTGHAIGASTAPVTLVEYSDLGCSFCRRAHEILSEQLYKTYTPGQVRWVYKHYPLTTTRPGRCAGCTSITR